MSTPMAGSHGETRPWTSAGTSSVVVLVWARRALCALPVGQVVETMRPLATLPFRGAPPFVLGLARIRGAAVPVVDLGSLLGSPEPAHATRFLVLKLRTRRFAVAVEGVLGLRELATEALSQLPPLLTPSNPQVAAVGMLDAEMLLSLDTSRIVPDRLWVDLEGGIPA